MGYKLKKTSRIDLSDLGDNNGVPFFVEIKNPKMMSVEEQLDLAEQSKSLQDDSQQGGQKQKLIDSLRNMIVSWNLIDIETEMPVAVDDADAFKKIPGEVMVAITKGITSIASKASDEQKNSSGPSDKSSGDGQQQSA